MKLNQCRVFKHRIIQIIILTIVVVLVMVTLSQTYRKANRSGGYDFTCYLTAAKALWAGENPYTVENSFPFLYPLSFAFFLYPLAIIPYWLANLLWFLVNLGALLAIVKMSLSWIRAILPFDRDRDYLVPLFFVVISAFNAIQNHFLNGQVNFLVLFLCLLFFKLQYDNKSTTSALILSLAILIKVVPVIFLVYLFIRKKYKTLCVTIVFVIVGAFLPYLLVGNTMFDFYRVYLKGFIFSNLTGAEEAYRSEMFFTIQGFVSYLIPAYGNHTIVKILSVFIPLAAIIKIGISIPKEGVSMLVQFQYFGMYLPGILLISPMSETHHLIYVLPVFLILVLELLFLPKVRDYISIAGITVFYILFVIVGKIFQTGPGYFFSIVTLFTVNLAMLQRMLYRDTHFQGVP